MLDDNEQVEVINETINTACEIIRADENRKNEVSVDWQSEIECLKARYEEEKEYLGKQNLSIQQRVNELNHENDVLKAKLEVVELIFGSGKLDYGQIQNKRV